MHRTRLRRHSDPNIALIKRYKNELCILGGCQKKRMGMGLCSEHYTPLRRKKLIEEEKFCNEGGCNEVLYAKGYCQKHWSRLRRHPTPSEDQLLWVREGKKRIFTPELKKKMSLAQMGKRGKETSNWRGGTTAINKRIRGTNHYKEWRIKVFTRDKYSCQECGNKCSEKNPVYLNAHHIRSFKDCPLLRFDVNNGITLCQPCHKKIQTKESEYIQYFLKKIENQK